MLMRKVNSSFSMEPLDEIDADLFVEFLPSLRVGPFITIVFHQNRRCDRRLYGNVS